MDILFKRLSLNSWCIRIGKLNKVSYSENINNFEFISHKSKGTMQTRQARIVWQKLARNEPTTFGLVDSHFSPSPYRCLAVWQRRSVSDGGWSTQYVRPPLSTRVIRSALYALSGLYRRVWGATVGSHDVKILLWFTDITWVKSNNKGKDNK